MIIFRVTTGRSWTTFPTAVKDSDSSGAGANPIQFAHQTAESSFLQSTLSSSVNNGRSGSLYDPNLTDAERAKESLASIQITGEKSVEAKLEV
ncbi:hypothetical protein H1R20_g13258, partial [Candolleomyces eurysporus]